MAFNPNTFHEVDRVMVLRINVDDDQGVSVEELLDTSATEARSVLQEQNAKLIYTINRGRREQRPVELLAVIDRAFYSPFEIRRFENGAIRIYRDGEQQQVVVKEILRSIAASIGVEITNTKGGIKNTQQLGADIIRALNSRSFQKLDDS